MDYLVISIGQAGNQINYELANLFLKESKEEYKNSFLTIQGDLAKNILIDTEPKVINKYTIDDKMRKLYAKDINIITNSSGRGNNWAMGYSLDYKEIKTGGNEYKSSNISIDSIEKINRFIERCDFLKGIIFIHSINGGTGSGLGTRIIEMMKDQYPKFTFIDCPVLGLNVENTTLSQFNKFFSFCHLYEEVDYFFLLNNEKFRKSSKKFDFKSMNYSMAKIIFNFLISAINNRNSYTFDYAFQNLKFIDLIPYNMNYIMDSDINTETINKLINYNEPYAYLNIDQDKESLLLSHRNNILSADINLTSNNNSFNSIPKYDFYYKKIIKNFDCKVHSLNHFTDKSIKNNILNVDIFAKNYEHRYQMQNLANNIAEKIKAR